MWEKSRTWYSYVTCNRMHILWSKIQGPHSYRKQRDSVFHRSISKVRFPHFNHKKILFHAKNSELRFSYLKYTLFICHVRKYVPWFFINEQKSIFHLKIHLVFTWELESSIYFLNYLVRDFHIGNVKNLICDVNICTQISICEHIRDFIFHVGKICSRISLMALNAILCQKIIRFLIWNMQNPI